MKEKIVRLAKRICFLSPVATLMISIPSFAFMKWLLSVPIVEQFIHKKNSEQK